jgi:transcription initiation factor TFIIIB Brf1 subunit/transcription initiation factor TFIIB
MNKIPVMFKEVARDFNISTRKLLHVMSETDYVPALSQEDYIDRISRQFHISDKIKNRAKELVDEKIEGKSPTVQACCVMLKAAKENGVVIRKSEIAKALDVSVVAVNSALKDYHFNESYLANSLPYFGR